MKCHDIPELLAGLLYGELDDQTARAVEDHLAHCAACRAEWEALKATTQVLDQWEDLAPDRKHLFIEENISWTEGIKAFFTAHAWPRKLALGIPLAGVALLLLLSIVNFEAEYKQGQWRIAFGLRAKTGATSEVAVTAAIAQARQETLLLVADMLQQSETEQRREFGTLLTRFAQDVEQTRKRDLLVMGQGLEGLHLATQNRLDQTSRVIDDLVELAGYSLDKK